LDQFLHHTAKLGIPVEMVQSLEIFVETEVSCAPRFPLILTAEFHSNVKESEILERSESDILPLTPQP